jgi:antitoxin component YwqK of YwqJK toxin-antitoxin module
VATAIKKLAPEGGSGPKRYYYQSGQLKEVAHWKDYEVTRIDYYSLSGKCIYSASMHDGNGLAIALNDEGVITDIWQTKNYIREGAHFVFSDGRLSKILRREGDEIRSEATVDYSLSDPDDTSP